MPSAISCASPAMQPPVRAGTMETSRMPWRWLFSATGKHFTPPVASRASTTDTS
jgi:hypothetical protein